MRVIRTHNAYHLGDNLIHLHFLRKVALANPDTQFVHFAQWQYLRELRDLIQDVPNLSLSDFNYMLPSDSTNSWRGADGFWYSHPKRLDFVAFHLEAWFPRLCERMKVANPMREPKDMLFDYPAIQNPVPDAVPFDVLLIDAPPGSGQFQSYSKSGMERLLDDLEASGQRVVTSGTGYPDRIFSAAQIGNLSLNCHTIVMISTGPSWPTFNIWNQDSIKLRLILLDEERVNLAPNSMHCGNIDHARAILSEANIL